MKIAFIVESFPVLSQTFIVNQIVSLLQAGHEIQIYSLNKGEENCLQPKIRNFDLLKKVTYKEQKPNSYRKSLKEFLKWIKNNLLKIRWKELFLLIHAAGFKKKIFLDLFHDYKWFLIGVPYDVIHAHFGSSGIPIAFLKQNKLLRESKFVVTYHGYDLTPSLIGSYQRDYEKVFASANVFTVNTSFLKKILLKVKPDLKNIQILPVGLDTQYFRKQNKRARVFKIIFCGRLIPLKGPDLAIEIFKELINYGYNAIELEIIGDGGMRKSLEDKINHYGLNNKIFLRGALPQDSVKDLMEKSSVLILPGIHDPETGRTETQGLVIQEAQSMELPVIVSDVGGMKEGLLDGKTGFVVKEKDITGFAKAIEKLILNEDLRISMGLTGRNFTVKKYDSTHLRDRLIKIYQE